jgi:hypothetical protein
MYSLHPDIVADTRDVGNAMAKRQIRCPPKAGESLVSVNDWLD